MMRYDDDIMLEHMYICLSFKCEKNACLNDREFDLESDLVFIGPVFHNTTKTRLKIVGHCGYG